MTQQYLYANIVLFFYNLLYNEVGIYNEIIYVFELEK